MPKLSHTKKRPSLLEGKHTRRTHNLAYIYQKTCKLISSSLISFEEQAGLSEPGL